MDLQCACEELDGTLNDLASDFPLSFSSSAVAAYVFRHCSFKLSRKVASYSEFSSEVNLPAPFEAGLNNADNTDHVFGTLKHLALL